MILTKEQLVAGWRHVQGGFLLQQKDAPTVFVNREGLVWGTSSIRPRLHGRSTQATSPRRSRALKNSPTRFGSPRRMRP